MIPKNANRNFANASPVSQVATKKVQVICIKDEIKLLFRKKEKLNLELYRAHLKKNHMYFCNNYSTY